MASGRINQLLSLSNSIRRRITIAIDAVCLAVTAYLALAVIRAGLFAPNIIDWLAILTTVIITVLTLILSKSYRAIIRHLDIQTIVRIAISVVLASLLWGVISAYSGYEQANRLTLLLLQCVFSLLLLIGYRAGFYLYISTQKNQSRPTASVAVFGLGAPSRQFAASLTKSRKYKPVFFLVNDPSLGGGLVDGIRVYSDDHLDWALKRFNPSIFVFPETRPDSKEQTELVRRLLKAGIEIKLFDGVDASLNKNIVMEVARPMQIEDLLGRNANPVEQALLQDAVAGHHILITGAAGSIGSQLCRRIAELGPASMCMMDIDESGLNSVRDEILAIGYQPKLFLGSIADREFVGHMLKEGQVDTIIHAAAYKHVTMGEECAHSVIDNNIVGTFNLLESALDAGISRFLQISTDKAVEPSSVMGATKLWCEKIVCGYATQNGTRRFASVRFGNVIESRGSVIPKFKMQIANGGPVTVTNPEMQRYFMSIDEAVDLVIQAMALTKGGETFILDMGEPHYILDIAKSVIQLAGKTIKSESRPDGDIEITFTGGQSVEKFKEKLFSSSEVPIPASHPSISISRTACPTVDELKKMRDELIAVPHSASPTELRAILFDQIGKFEPEGNKHVSNKTKPN